MAPLPTFQNDRDRLTYLLGEYKLLISGLLLGAVALVVYYEPTLPDLPEWVPAVAAAWLLLGIPCWFAGVKVYKWLRQRNWVTVYHVNAVEDTREKWLVPPQVWQNKKVEDGAPNLVNDKSAFEVREFDWQSGTDTLVVAGTWLGEASDGELVTDKKHMEAIHSYLLDAFEQLKQLRATWSDQAIELQGDIINTGAEARERGQMLDQDSASDTWEKYVDNVAMDEDPPSLREQVQDRANDPIDEPLGPEDMDPLNNGDSHE